MEELTISRSMMRKEHICHVCRERICCYHYRVSVTGYDVWRIVKSLDLPSWAFLTYTEADPESTESFILDSQGPPYELILAKTEDQRRYGGCVFLVKTNDGESRCGLGDLKPDQCRMYPVFFYEGVAAVIQDREGCCRVWSLAEIDIEAEREASTIYSRRRKEYGAVLSQWNQWVRSNGKREFNFYEFCTYLENRYAGDTG